ncbi:MAG: methyltransferase domain-containing protein [Betaproteobacteria bacterium]|nr:methyltransferase domain-containing protein [Betaproteobacteria bacterium]
MKPTRVAAAFFAAVAIRALAADVVPLKNAGPYVPSPDAAVAAMLQYAHVGPNDFLIDLGSGDGRIVRTAAKVFGARGMGVEIKESLVRQANEEAKKEGIADKVRFVKQDLFKTDISQATVLTMYLLPDTVNMLREKLATELKPGTRIVSHDYPLTGWLPDDMKQFDLPEKEAISGVQTTIVWLYVVPAKVEGDWSARLPASLSRAPATLRLRQQLTRVSGSVVLDGKEIPLEDVRLRGEELAFRIAGRKPLFTGQVKGRSIEGTMESGANKTAWTASLGS